MVPNAPELRLPLGPRKLARFSRLKASSRNSNCAGPPTAKRLESAVSSCQNIGPRTVFRFALPNGWLGSVGALTHDLSNQLLMVWASPCA